jgi:hypothetical protein
MDSTACSIFRVVIPRLRTAWTTWAVLLALLACSRKPADPVRDLVDELAEAAEDRDADRVLARLSDTFQGQGQLAKADVAASLRRYFAAYESIDLELYDVQTEPAEGLTRVRMRVGFSGKAQKAFGLDGLLPPSAVYAFDLDTRDEGDTWRVTRASWEATPAAGR